MRQIEQKDIEQMKNNSIPEPPKTMCHLCSTCLARAYSRRWYHKAGPFLRHAAGRMLCCDALNVNSAGRLQVGMLFYWQS